MDPGWRTLACFLTLATLTHGVRPRTLLENPHHPRHRPLLHPHRERDDVVLDQCVEKHFIYWNCSKHLQTHSHVVHSMGLPPPPQDFRLAVEEAWQRVGDAETQTKEVGGMMERLGLWESAIKPEEERLRESWVLDKEKRRKYLEMRLNIHRNNMVVAPTLRMPPRIQGIPLYCGEGGMEPEPREVRSKRVAVLYRGQCFRTGHGELGMKQQVEVLEMQERTLLRPLRDRGYEVDVFLAVYRDELYEAGTHLQTLIAKLEPKGVVILPGAPQSTTYVFESEIAVMSMLLSTMEEMETMYDLVHITRYDLVYKAPILDFPDVDPLKFNFPFKEKSNAWRTKYRRTVHDEWSMDETPRVGDACFTFHGAYSAGFLAEIVDEFLRVLPDGIEKWNGHPWPRDRIEIYHHFMWWGIASFIGEGNLAFLADSLHDSNEAKEDQNANPVYFFQRDYYDPEFDAKICSKLEHFKRDAPGASLCCPTHRYCCPNTVSNCTASPDARFAEPRGPSFPDDPPEEPFNVREWEFPWGRVRCMPDSPSCTRWERVAAPDKDHQWWSGQETGPVVGGVVLPYDKGGPGREAQNPMLGAGASGPGYHDKFVEKHHHEMPPSAAIIK